MLAGAAWLAGEVNFEFRRGRKGLDRRQASDLVVDISKEKTRTVFPVNTIEPDHAIATTPSSHPVARQPEPGALAGASVRASRAAVGASWPSRVWIYLVAVPQDHAATR